MFDKQRFVVGIGIAVIVSALTVSIAHAESRKVLDQIGVTRGICVLLGDMQCELALELVGDSELLVYMQFSRAEEVENARRAVDAAGVYGTRIYVDKGVLTRLHLADSMADAVIAIGDSAELPEAEALRVLRPQGKALLGARELIKPFPEGIDDWSHPYHGPDNNPQSKDGIARAPYLTQFLAGPQYAPVPQIMVASAGRAFNAFGHVAFHKREEPFLNKLVAFNGYNGTILWQRDLVEGIMVHRNTMIATPSILYVADDKSCKLIDAATGELKDEISPPAGIADGTFWKWMALEDGVLYALIGEQEQLDTVERWNREAHGWPWDKISRGYNQPEHTWGFGRTVLAIDAQTKKILWTHREAEPTDSRAVCMKNGRLYIFRFGQYLICLDAKTGREIWRKTKDNGPELFTSLGKYLNRQSWETNWRTTAYLKCSDEALYFAGPPIGKLLVVSTEDGRILWEDAYNNFQLILRDDAVYGIGGGSWQTKISKKFNPRTGEVLAELKIGRRACTRITASIDAIFTRAMGGSLRLDLATDRPQWISPMRPPCFDGVVTADGLLYWMPFVCDCQLTLYGLTCLGPAGGFEFNQQATEAARLETAVADVTEVASLPESPADWPTFRGNNTGTATTRAVVSEVGNLRWEHAPNKALAYTPTAPVAAGGLVLVGGSDGIVRAFDAATGEVRWTAYTGGAIRLPPTIWKGRALVGSGDGWVYALEARTGRLLWRFRAAPVERRIPVYGSLLSTWPAASGVLVEEGIAYVAAGIANYDGTHVYALDAATGRIKWQNNTSGHLYPEARTGVSVQGHMLLHGGKLFLAGGNAVSPAVYDLSDGRCLNDPEQLKHCESMCPRGWELFLIGDQVEACGKPFYLNPKYPVFDNSVFKKMLVASIGDRDVIWMDNKKVMCFESIDKESLSKCAAKRKRKKVGHIIPAWGKLDIPNKPLWERDCDRSVALAVSGNAVIVAGESEIDALNLADGKLLWNKPLSSTPVPWGLAIDAAGRIAVTLEDGRVLCFQ